MIEGYLNQETVTIGGSVRIHVSTDSPLFRIDFYRLGELIDLVMSSDWRTGVEMPPPPHPDGHGNLASPSDDWNWPAYAFPVPDDWRPGIYLARFVEGTVQGQAVGRPTAAQRRMRGAGGTDREFFIVRPRVPGSVSRILYKKSTFTRHAYNLAGHPSREGAGSLYENPVYQRTPPPPGHKISMRRPGGVNDLGYWDAPFIGWLEHRGYEVEYCGDLDLHRDPRLLDDYRLLLSVGHDEYWSQAMRDHTEGFVRAGGNVVFLSGNTSWWRVHVTDAETAFVSDTDHEVDGVYPHLPATDNWWAAPPNGVGRPENTLTGVSFRNGGEWPGDWPGDRPCPGFTVQHSDHWVFEGTGLSDGEVFAEGVPLVGYECDGAAFSYDRHGVARATGEDGTPDSFLILGIALLQPVNDRLPGTPPGYWSSASREPSVTSPRAATMGIRTEGGTVFTAATTDWPNVVGRRLDPTADRITRNLLDRLGSGRPPAR